MAITGVVGYSTSVQKRKQQRAIRSVLLALKANVAANNARMKFFLNSIAVKKYFVAWKKKFQFATVLIPLLKRYKRTHFRYIVHSVFKMWQYKSNIRRLVLGFSEKRLKSYRRRQMATICAALKSKSKALVILNRTSIDQYLKKFFLKWKILALTRSKLNGLHNTLKMLNGLHLKVSAFKIWRSSYDRTAKLNLRFFALRKTTARIKKGGFYRIWKGAALNRKNFVISVRKLNGRALQNMFQKWKTRYYEQRLHGKVLKLIGAVSNSVALRRAFFALRSAAKIGQQANSVQKSANARLVKSSFSLWKLRMIRIRKIRAYVSNLGVGEALVDPVRFFSTEYPVFRNKNSTLKRNLAKWKAKYQLKTSRKGLLAVFLQRKFLAMPRLYFIMWKDKMQIASARRETVSKIDSLALKFFDLTKRKYFRIWKSKAMSFLFLSILNAKSASSYFYEWLRIARMRKVLYHLEEESLFKCKQKIILNWSQRKKRISLNNANSLLAQQYFSMKNALMTWNHIYQQRRKLIRAVSKLAETKIVANAFRTIQIALSRKSSSKRMSNLNESYLLSRNKRTKNYFTKWKGAYERLLFLDDKRAEYKKYCQSIMKQRYFMLMTALFANIRKNKILSLAQCRFIHQKSCFQIWRRQTRMELDNAQKASKFIIQKRRDLLHAVIVSWFERISKSNINYVALDEWRKHKRSLIKLACFLNWKQRLAISYLESFETFLLNRNTKRALHNYLRHWKKSVRNRKAARFHRRSVVSKSLFAWNRNLAFRLQELEPLRLYETAIIVLAFRKWNLTCKAKVGLNIPRWTVSVFSKCPPKCSAAFFSRMNPILRILNTTCVQISKDTSYSNVSARNSMQIIAPDKVPRISLRSSTSKPPSSTVLTAEHLVTNSYDKPPVMKEKSPDQDLLIEHLDSYQSPSVSVARRSLYQNQKILTLTRIFVKWEQIFAKRMKAYTISEELCRLASMQRILRKWQKARKLVYLDIEKANITRKFHLNSGSFARWRLLFKTSLKFRVLENLCAQEYNLRIKRKVLRALCSKAVRIDLLQSSLRQYQHSKSLRKYFEVWKEKNSIMIYSREMNECATYFTHVRLAKKTFERWKGAAKYVILSTEAFEKAKQFSDRRNLSFYLRLWSTTYSLLAKATPFHKSNLMRSALLKWKRYKEFRLRFKLKRLQEAVKCYKKRQIVKSFKCN
jgi:hypothetical protein